MAKLTVRDKNELYAKPIELEIEVYDTTLETLLLDSHDLKLYGHDTVEEFVSANDSYDNLDVLRRVPDSVEVLSGSRLDILVRTSNGLLNLMSQVYLRDDLTKSILHRVQEKLEKPNVFDEDMLEDIYEIDSMDMALKILGK